METKNNAPTLKLIEGFRVLYYSTMSVTNCRRFGCSYAVVFEYGGRKFKVKQSSNRLLSERCIDVEVYVMAGGAWTILADGDELNGVVGGRWTELSPGCKLQDIVDALVENVLVAEKYIDALYGYHESTGRNDWVPDNAIM